MSGADPRPAAPALVPRAERIWRAGGLSVRWRPRAVAVSLALVVLVAACAVAGLLVGTLPIGLADLAGVAAGSADERISRIVSGVRVPRVVTGIFVGAALGASGAAFQSISRNALGSPDIIGFVTGAATGAVVAITVFGASGIVVAGAAVAGGVITALAVVLLSGGSRGDAGHRLILVGIGAGALLAAVNAVMLTRTDANVAIAAQIWLTGTLNARTAEQALTAVVAVAVLLPPLVALSRRLEVMEMGDEFAAGVGVPIAAVRRATVIVAVALAAVATALCGPISFVALAAPHLARRLLGGAGVPVLGAALTGSVLLVGADLATQLLPFGLRVPVALMTGVLGGVYLIWLLTRSRRL
ncbi:FecCD family ABC transporter permease [Microbacterium marinilacus]|uniref:Iron chelate uptake ABC transporter family permease subunit n=1 Tax=Microbacterium marinilacus TaxID=415209 RepID=A0ABP7BU74_9MICO|nr:iron chelate uptake ABC transporter family permease subunit [Microbacterium marinilacus]